jgi:hypothetical protein
MHPTALEQRIAKRPSFSGSASRRKQGRERLMRRSPGTTLRHRLTCPRGSNDGATAIE